MKGLFFLACSVLLVGASAKMSAWDGPKKTAKELLSDGLATAKNEKKNVFLVIGSLGCNYTVFLDQYHKDPAVKKILEPHYVFVRIEWPEVTGGKELWEFYAKGKLRVPIWVILDPTGKILASSGPTDASGYPKDAEDVLHYTKALEIGSPRLSRSDIELLHHKLKQHGK